MALGLALSTGTYFMIVYERRARRLLDVQAHPARDDALLSKLTIERQRRPGSDVEVVVLAASSAAELRRRHPR